MHGLSLLLLFGAWASTAADLEQLAKDVLGVLEEQQPLRDAVGSVLKAIKPALDDASVSDEFAMQQVWSEGKGN